MVLHNKRGVIFFHGSMKSYDLSCYNDEYWRDIMSENTLPRRQDIPVEDTWDLTSIFADDQAFEAAFAQIEAEHGKAEKFKGRLASSSDALLEAIRFEESISILLGKVYVYMHLNFDTDTTNPTYQAYNARVLNLLSQVSASFSFYASELMEADEMILRGYLKENEALKIYAHDFEKLFKKRKHILSEAEEKILAEASSVFESSEHTFGMLNNADIKFPTITGEDGQPVQITHGRYGLLLESKNREVRRDAFKGVYQTYGDLNNTFASTLSGKIKLDNFSARIRHYGSAREAALAHNDIPETVYDALIEAVNDHLPLLHRYVSLRKQVLGLDEIAMYDLYTPLVEELDIEFTYEEAQKIILEALQPMGQEYVGLLKKAFDSRWIDVRENVGKRSGAYSSGTYGTEPYILMNWQNNLDNVFTLAHELGHSLHSYYTRHNQPYVYGDYSIFVAEIASTTNENLLTDYFLKKYDDPKVRAYILNHYLDGVKGTVFRQTQFAEFEWLIHRAEQEGTGLTAAYLNEQYFAMNQRYYGDEMVYDEEIGKEWSRIPHFYYNYYVYQYATGFSAATALASKILEEGAPAVEAYINYLKAGRSDYPIEVMKRAGVDMTTNKPVVDTMKVFEARLSELEALLK